MSTRAAALIIPTLAIPAGAMAAYGIADWSGPGFSGAVNQGALALRLLGLVAFAGGSLLFSYPAFSFAIHAPVRWYERIGVPAWALLAWVGGVTLAFAVLVRQP